VLDIAKQLTMSNAVAPQLVGHDHSRDISQTLQKSPEEALRRVAIPPGLNENVEHGAVLIDGTSEIVLHALDPDEHLIDVPFVSRLWPAAAQTVGEFVAPAPHRFIGDDDVAFSQQQLDIPQAEGEHMVQPHGVADGSEPMAVRRVGWRLHAASFVRQGPRRQAWLP
jgi:hypothetical protein